MGTTSAPRRRPQPYRELQSDLVCQTIAALGRRIADRFPGSGLSGVSAELQRVSTGTADMIRSLERPIWPLRLFAFLGAACMLAAVAELAYLAVNGSRGAESIADVIQATEATCNVIILLALALFFLVTLEVRVKRRAALRSLRHLRSIVHIVDMHQLTKDPGPALAPGRETPSSPSRQLTSFELARYLDYCSELLSLTSKLAALHAERLHDPVIVGAVSDIEVLSASLSSKIWQKIAILDWAIKE